MTKEELAQKIKDSNYTCKGISCNECKKVNGFGVCLQEDRKLFVSLVLPVKEELKKEANNYAKEITDLEKEKCELLGIIQGKDTAIHDLQNENKILTKALNLYINWVDECGIAWDNFPDEKEKWLKTVEEKGFGWIEGLTFMVMEEAKEQLQKEEQND